MKQRRSRITTETVIKMFQETHGEKYNYSLVNYKTMHHKVKIKCRIHGVFEQTPNAHFRRGDGCPKCSSERISSTQRDTTDSFIKKAIEVHGNRYDYSKVVYGKNAHDKVEIVCKQHGSFFMTPNDHLSQKSNCPVCAKNYKGWTKEAWKKSCEGKVAKFYIIKCYGGKEVFYKVGMTNKKTIEEKFRCDYLMPYAYDIVKIIESKDDPISIWQLEKSFLKLHKEFEYKPLNWFEGYTECLSKILI